KDSVIFFILFYLACEHAFSLQKSLQFIPNLYRPDSCWSTCVDQISLPQGDVLGYKRYQAIEVKYHVLAVSFLYRFSICLKGDIKALQISELVLCDQLTNYPS